MTKINSRESILENLLLGTNPTVGGGAENFKVYKSK